MKICVFGLWHLGSVTAACLSTKGHQVVAIDPNPETIDRLKKGSAPLFEPELDLYLQEGLRNKTLNFDTAYTKAADAEVLWVTFDTPVNEEDQADALFVESRTIEILPHLKKNSVVIISSQVPVGFTRKIMQYANDVLREHCLTFAYSPENLRLGKAISVFLNPERVIVGTASEKARELVQKVFAPITDRIEWMGIESAEMTKHAINAFLAISVTFINEIATLCEQVGADAKEVEWGLKSEERIGPKAYLSPGSAFSGGTLARDISMLNSLGFDKHLALPLLASVPLSNEEHKKWAIRRLHQIFGDMNQRVISILGLTYKPGTNTLRRSLPIDLCEWLLQSGATVNVHDPVIETLPVQLSKNCSLFLSYEDAIKGSDALILATEWPLYKSITKNDILSLMRTPLVLDANRFVSADIGNEPRITYLSVGRKS